MKTLPNRIRGVDYDVEKKELTVRFPVGEYRYAGVPTNTADTLCGMVAAMHYLDASAFFDAAIEGKFKSVRSG